MEGATDKQIAFLQKRGITEAVNWSKLKASQEIDKLLNPSTPAAPRKGGEKDASIIAQCLTKVYHEGKKPESRDEVLETYEHYFKKLI